MPRRFSACGERLELLARRDLRIEAVVVGDIVAMAAPGARLEDGGEIAVADAKLVEVGNQLRRLPQVEVAVQLQPVGRAWNRTA